MKVNYTIDLAAGLSGVIHFRAVFSGHRSGTALKLPVLLAKTGAAVEGLYAANQDGEKLRLKVSGELLSVNARCFTLAYSLRITLKECVGTDRETELLYPFLNASEIFLGSGALPYPKNLSGLADEMQAELRLTGQPRGWDVFSSLPDKEVPAASLDSFFIYCSKNQAFFSKTHSSLSGRTTFYLLVQKGKTIPGGPGEALKFTTLIMRQLEKTFVLYNGVRLINILILQPPANFECIARGATFATGENMLRGIAMYTPKSSAYIRRLFGHESYRCHLRDGLAHELAHLYSTTAWQGRFKSLLYPAASCNSRHRRLIGETLTTYFHEAILCCLPGAKLSFISKKVLPQLGSWKVATAKKPLLDLFLLDLWLRQKKSSLKSAIVHLINEYGLRHKPYGSGAVLAQAAEKCGGALLPPYLRKILLTPHVPDYEAELKNFPGWDRDSFSPLRG